MQVKITASKKQLKEWFLHEEFKKGNIYDVEKDGNDYFLFHGFSIPVEFTEPFYSTPNRDFLRDFIGMNNIRTHRVSKALGMSRNWLTQMMNEKSRDMPDATLKSILAKLHIDWASKQWLQVQATKEHTAYKTQPSTYTTDAHKERLQRSFWNGNVTHG